MSDLMFFDVPVNDTKKVYTFGDWKEYAIHDDKNIKGFFGKYRFLSNFETCLCYFDGVLYPSSENAYQAAKIIPSERTPLVTCSAAESKRVWKTLTPIDDSSSEWDKRKYDVMASIVFDKFYRNKDLRQKLLDTNDKYLEETNHWKDQFWGVDIKKGGQNNLGKILTKTREYWK